MAGKKHGKDIVKLTFSYDPTGKTYAAGDKAVDFVAEGFTPEQIEGFRANGWTVPEDQAAEEKAQAEADAEAVDDDKGESYPHYYGTGTPPANTWEGRAAAAVAEREAAKAAKEAAKVAAETEKNTAPDTATTSPTDVSLPAKE